MRTLMQMADIEKTAQGPGMGGGTRSGAASMLQGRPAEIVQNLVQIMSSTAPREWERMMRRLRVRNPRVARILVELSDVDQADAEGMPSGPTNQGA